jgi:hypothetical protein
MCPPKRRNILMEIKTIAMRIAIHGMKSIKNCPPRESKSPMTPKNPINPSVTTPLITIARHNL